MIAIIEPVRKIICTFTFIATITLGNAMVEQAALALNSMNRIQDPKAESKERSTASESVIVVNGAAKRPSLVLIEALGFLTTLSLVYLGSRESPNNRK